MRWMKDGTVFQLAVNVKPFGPSGIRVFATRNGDVIVHAGHDEQMEGDGHVTRRFEGRIAIPIDMDPDTIESCLLPNGILLITAKQVTSHFEKIIPVFPADPHRHLSDHPKVSPGGP